MIIGIAVEAFYSNNEFFIGPPEFVESPDEFGTPDEFGISLSPTFIIPPKRYRGFIRRLTIDIHSDLQHWFCLRRFSNVFNTWFTRAQELTVNLNFHNKPTLGLCLVIYHRETIKFRVPKLEVVFVIHTHENKVSVLPQQS